MQALQDIFRKVWPSPKALAEDIGELEDTVYRWEKRGRIPEEHFEKVIQKAAIREHFLTVSQLLSLNRRVGRRGAPRKKRKAVRTV